MNHVRNNFGLLYGQGVIGRSFTPSLLAFAVLQEKESDMEKLQALMEHNAKLELNSKQE